MKWRIGVKKKKMKSEGRKFGERKEKALKILSCSVAVMIVVSGFGSLVGSQPEVSAIFFDSIGIEETQDAALFSHVEVSPYGSWPGYLKGKIEVKEGSPANYKSAVYILVGGGWWTKPYWASPWTEVKKDGNFSCLITTGGQDQLATKIAAFLVPEDYEIPDEELLRSGQQTLPEELEKDAVDKIIIDLSPKLRKIEFSGYTWLVKTSGEGTAGPGPNYFSDSVENVWIDGQGQLHLKITHREGKWYCAEVISKRSFGYGKYIFYLASRVDQLDKNVVLGLFTWDDTCPKNRREIDIEFARWGEEAAENAQFVVQPWYHPGNRHRFNIQLKENYSTHSLEWESESIFFQSLSGHYISPPNESYIIESWNYTGEDIPESGSENARINLWLFNGNPPFDGKEVEVIIRKFEFIPTRIFDTGEPENPYPSIFGTHNGTIKPNQLIIVHKLYTYPCTGTGGHTEYVRIWNDTWDGKEAYWNGYREDWRNITFDETFMLFAEKTYYYEIRTGSYPQIIHKPEHTTLGGSFINCTSFVDANGKECTGWIPAIRLWA